MTRNLLAMAALMAMGGNGMLVADDRPRAAAAPLKRKRNYDLEGPEAKAGPPTARDAVLPTTRQQRRWLERQSKKGGQE